MMAIILQFIYKITVSPPNPKSLGSKPKDLINHRQGVGVVSESSKNKPEFATSWQLFTHDVHCIYSYFHSIYIVLQVI